MKKLLLLFSLISLVSIANAQWQQTNGPKSFEVQCFAAKDSTIYMGTYNAGFLISTDKGQHWVKKSNSIIDNSGVSAITIKDSTIFLGAAWAGVFKSINNCNTWSYISNGFVIHADSNTNDTTTHPFITDFIWSNNNLVAATGEGIYYSSDMGQNWNVSGSIPLIYSINKLTKKDSVLYAALPDLGIYKSTDDGVTWNSVNNPGSHISFITSNSTSIIAQCDTNKFYRSDDDGATWQILNTGIPNQDYVITSLLCKEQELYIGTNGYGIFYSPDNGASWTTINNGLTMTGFEALFANGTDLYAGGYIGMFYSPDNGLSWDCRNNNIGRYTNPKKIVSMGENIVVFDHVLGLVYSPDQGETWRQMNNGIPFGVGGNDGDIASMGTELIFAGPHKGIFFSADTGKTWQNRNNGLPCPGASSVTISGTDIFITNDDCGVFISSNNGLTWTSVQNGLPAYSYSRALAANDSIIYAAFDNGTIVYESRNKGTTWTGVNQTNLLWNIKISGSAVMFLLSDNVAISMDNGYTWANTVDLPYDTIINGYDIYSGTTDGSSFYLGTQRHGVYKLFSNHWIPINDGFSLNPNFNINDLTIKDTVLLAAISDEGVWKRSATNIYNTNCSAQFTIVPDTVTPHHYYLLNNASGISPLSYLWSWGDGTYDYIAFPSHTYSAAGNYKICLTITDSIGCTSTYCDSSYLQKSTNTVISVDVIPSGISVINENELSDQIHIFPNPASDNLTIETPQKSEIEIVNLQGQLTKSFTAISNKTTIDVSDFAKGIYFVKVKTENGVAVEKFVKE